MSLVSSRDQAERPGGSRDPRGTADAEYHFLLERLVDASTLHRATALAARWGVEPHDVLIATGWLDADDYTRALADACGVPFRERLTPAEIAPPAKASPRQCLTHGLLKERGRANRFVLAPDRLRPNALRAMLTQLAPYDFAVASPHAVREAIHHHFARAFAHNAVETLATRRPDFSARGVMVRWQRVALGTSVTVLVSALLIAPTETVHALTLLLAVLFVPVIGLRLAAVYGLLRDATRDQQKLDPCASDATLPIYTILVPLYREAHMVLPLVRGADAARLAGCMLDIKLILEVVDQETIDAARALKLPGNVEIVIVPDFGPRTKPKALNYALPLARGEYLVIYDAEDRPRRDQLRQAFQAFHAGPPNLATVQARLNIYNTDDNWLTAQFTLEYSALFDGLLPVLDRLRLPIPLGGTSNHFRVSALKWLMSWDPYNVTEDADLGTRLARCGYCTRVINSTTYEEAPRGFMSWLRQRTRWLKGFVQTWLVHMRSPRALWRELGPSGFLGFQAMVGGTILSAVVHPWFYVLVGLQLVRDNLLARPEHLLILPFWGVAWFDLVSGYLAAMGLALLAARRRGLFRLVRHIPLMPLYWLLISAAAYRALWQFMTAPFKWEKTEHGLARAGQALEGNGAGSGNRTRDT
ncbi:MAG: glycosyltransferase family 2 protein [Hyphomicrobiales bacterium]